MLCHTAPHLKRLHLSYATGITDLVSGPLQKLRLLEDLWLDGTQITDAALVPLQNLTLLTELGLASTKGITDAAFKHLPQRHPLLKRLELGHTSITDVGVGYLQPCRNLKTLHLNHTDITNVALQHL